MKTSAFTAVEVIIKEIAAINRETIYLRECTECSFIVGSSQQKRVVITDNMPVYSLMQEAYSEHLNNRKRGLIEKLYSQYNVEYDGE